MNNFFNIFKAITIGFITGLFISLPLGPAGIESVKRTLSKGLKSGLIVSFGAIAADLAYLVLINFGLKNLITKGSKTEALFWIISGIILIFINIFSVKEKNKSLCISKRSKMVGDRFYGYGFMTGFLITFTNPLTPSLWFSLSGTVLLKWQKISSTCYYIFISSILLGMLTWFTLLNILALKGQKTISQNSTSKFSNLLKWIILLLGVIFVILGSLKLINL